MMEDVGEEIEDGSLPDLTHVDTTLSCKNMIMTDTQIQMPVIETAQHKETKDNIKLKTGQRFRGAKEKLLNKYENNCNDIKTALNGTWCLDTDKSKGTHGKQIVGSYIFQINFDIKPCIVLQYTKGGMNTSKLDVLLKAWMIIGLHPQKN